MTLLPRPVSWVTPSDPLPDPRLANAEGLVAAGADLSPARLLEAYQQGMFPWFNEGDPVLWWSPDPRMVLACEQFKISHSLGKKLARLEHGERLEQADGRVTTNTAFEQVIEACAAPRPGAGGTWILPPVRQVYAAWHHLGFVHSVETWLDGELAGGLYGVCVGRMFFGESMFSRATDASKIALAYLVRFLSLHGVTHIDCQQETSHLASLGAHTMPREAFMALIKRQTRQPELSWGRGQLLANGLLNPR
jgi:leucyl/phenylalanyl-tRNA--protein transferase